MKKKHLKNRYIITLVIIFLSFINYWPIPINFKHEGIHLLLLMTPFFCLIVLFFFNFAKKSIIGWLAFLLIFVFSVNQIKVRNAMNRYIIFANKNNTETEQFNALLGTEIYKKQDAVIYKWYLMPGDYEFLIYKKKHGHSNCEIGREIRIIINSDWYVLRNVDN